MDRIPLVSIALCTYNGEKFIREQLESILSQTYPSIEVIIVDDASTDGTFSILEAYSKRYNSIKLYSNSSNIGLTRNFERAIRLCTGEFIAYSDQDDCWLPDKILAQVSGIGDHQLIYHDSRFIDEFGEVTGKKVSDFKNCYQGNDPKVLLFNNCISGHSILMRRDLAERIIPFPEGIFYDWWTGFVALNRGSIAYLSSCLVLYRQHRQSMTSETFQSRGFGQVDMCRRMELFKDHPDCRIGPFVEKILMLQERQLSQRINVRLFFMILFNFHSLMWIRKKGLASKINSALKNLYKRTLNI